MSTTGDRDEGLKLSPVQITASALASVSAAVVASYFGVAGTLLGAALASVVATAGSAIYGHSLQRTGRRLAKVRDVVPSHRLRLRVPRRPGIRWGTVGVAAFMVFAFALSIITIIEKIQGQSVSATVRGESGGAATSLGRVANAVTGGAPGTTNPTPVPTSTRTATPSPTPTPTSTVTSPPTGTTPTPTTTATEPPAGTRGGESFAPATPSYSPPVPTPQPQLPLPTGGPTP